MIDYPNGSALPNGSATSENYGFWHDEEGSAGSVTKQLAETAVGVREMSKQLGELHSELQYLLYRAHCSLCIHRSYSCSLCYSIRLDRHKSPRQQAHSADKGARLVFDAQAKSGR